MKGVRGVLSLTGPLAASELGSIGMTAADTIMVGRLGADAVAALGFAGAYQLVVIGFLFGTLGGVTPLVSQAFGANERTRIRELAGAALALALLVALPAALLLSIGWVAAVWTGQPASVVAGARDYLVASAWAVPGLLIFAAGRVTFEGLGRPRGPMIITLVALVANVALNALLIPRFGVAGAGYATSMARTGMGAAMLVLLARQLPFEWRALTGSLRAHGTRILVVGVPIGVHYSLELAVFAVLATVAGMFGVATLAAWQIAINAVQTVFVVAYAIGSAGSIMLGRAIGANDRHAALDAIGSTFRLTLVSAIVSGLAFAAAPDAFARLYISDASVLDVAVPFFAIAALFTLVDQFQVCGLTLLHGAADTAMSGLIALAGYWMIVLPAVWILRSYTSAGILSLWLGLGVGATVMGIAAAVRLWTLTRHECVLKPLPHAAGY